MLDRLTSMTVFVCAAESGSFTAASEKLDISSQMVAKHVHALEQRLGMRLLNRSTRRQSLTEFGGLYLERCRAILADVAETDALAQELNAIPRGRLRISAPVTFGRYGLMPVVTRFVRDYPEIEVDLVLSDALVDPVQGGYEAIVRIGPLDENLLMIARRLNDYCLVACASPAYLKNAGTPMKPAELTDHECIGFTPWPVSLNRQWRFSRNGRSYDIGVSSRLNLNDWGAIHSAALDGFGVVLGYEHALADDLSTGRLIRVLPSYEGPARPMHILYAAERRMTPKLRFFVERVVDAFGGRTSLPPINR